MISSAPAEAVVIPFPTAEFRQHRLTTRDRISVLAWTEGAGRVGYDRVVIRERHPQDDPHIGDFLSIYRAGEPWAAWGVARHGASVRVWRSATGADLGEFRTIEEALGAILNATASAEPRLRKQPA
jgi:hypothetical protein